MIVESAFNILPESIAGLGFQKVKREANAVGVFSFSLLNALHAKNVIDPIQRLQLEMPYETRNAPLPAGGTARHCDAFIDYGGSKIGSQRLANYGWRYRNYIEAKFLKSYKLTRTGQDTRSSANSAQVIADLLRLVALVPEPECYIGRNHPKTASARYFLVLAEHLPSIFINKYLKDLHATFDRPYMRTRIEVDLTSGKAARALAENVGSGFGQIRLDLTQCTCFAHYPFNGNVPESCWMLLIRIDEARISLTLPSGTHVYSILNDRSLVEQSRGDYRAIRDFVAINIK